MLHGTETRFSSEGLGRYGRYRVERLIGSGSAGAVFLGRDPILGRPVAIKVIPLRTCRGTEEKAERLELLRRAFGPLGSLAHQNLVTVHDVGIEEEHSFLVMEYVPGRNLASHLADGLLVPDRVAAVATQLAAALDFAHDHELTHGDLKPANVLVTPGWEVKLTDLGVVSALSSSGLGHANTRWDRPEHLAPEVAEGGPPTPASDRFSLGVLLYSLLTGRLPFQGDDATATLWRIANEQPPLPSDLAPELPATVDGVLLRALAKEPEERYPTCAELADCLARALADRDQPVPAVYATQPLDEDLRRQLRIASATTPLPDEARASEPATPAPRPARPRPAAPTPRRRRRRRLWPWAVLLLLLLAGTVAWLLPGGRWRALLGDRQGDERRGAEGFSWDASASPPTTAEETGEELERPTASEPDHRESPAEEAAPISTEPFFPAEAPAPGPERLAPDAAPEEDPAPARTRAAVPGGLDELPAAQEARLRIRLASEVQTGDVRVWAGDRIILERRFHFGGPLQRLRRNAPPGGQWEEIVALDPGPALLRVRVTLPTGTLEEIPLRRTLTAGEERILEIRVSPRREITASWR